MIKTNYSFPIWLMRQSGRYLPEYQQIRQKYSFMDILKNPDLIAHLTLLPLKYFDLDALIIFSDISIVFDLFKNIQHNIVENMGPVVEVENIDKIRLKETSQLLENLKEGIKKVKQSSQLTLIGFVGGIWTTLHYLLKHSKYNKEILYQETQILHLITEAIYKVIKIQAESKVDIIQIFDTYLLDLSPFDIEFYILPFYKILFQKISDIRIPITFFSLNSIHILNFLEHLKVNCLSVDWKQDLSIYFKNFPKYIQGNLDPNILTIQDKDIFQKVLQLSLIRIFKAIENKEHKNRYIFNLGHGILPSTKIDNVKYLIEKLREGGK